MRRNQKNSKRKSKRKRKTLSSNRLVLPNLVRPQNSNREKFKKPDVQKTQFGDSRLPDVKVDGKGSERKVRINEKNSKSKVKEKLPIITNKEKQTCVSSSKGQNENVFSSDGDAPSRTGFKLRPQEKSYSKCDSVKDSAKECFSEGRKKYIPGPSNRKNCKENILYTDKQKSSQRNDHYFEPLQGRNSCAKYNNEKDTDSNKKQKHALKIGNEVKGIPSEREKFKSIPRKMLHPNDNYSPVPARKKYFAEKFVKPLDSVDKNMQHLGCNSHDKKVCELKSCAEDVSEEKRQYAVSQGVRSKDAWKCGKFSHFKPQEQTNKVLSYSKEDYTKERSDVDNERPKKVKLKNKQDGLMEKMESGIFKNFVPVDLSYKNTDSKEFMELISNRKKDIVNVENQESGLSLSKESGGSVSVMSIDENIYEQDLIFEEVVDMNGLHSQHHQRTKQSAKIPAKRIIRKPLNKENLESGLQVSKDRGSLLSTKEFKLEGYEIDSRKVPLSKKAKKKIPLASSKPKICRQKLLGIEDSVGVQGFKVQGCSVDMDEYVIAMVRLVNCNDNLDNVQKRDFPCKLFQEYL